MQDRNAKCLKAKEKINLTLIRLLRAEGELMEATLGGLNTHLEIVFVQSLVTLKKEAFTQKCHL